MRGEVGDGGGGSILLVFLSCCVLQVGFSGVGSKDLSLLDSWFFNRRLSGGVAVLSMGSEGWAGLRALVV